jgi:hypothetical protein
MLLRCRKAYSFINFRLFGVRIITHTGRHRTSFTAWTRFGGSVKTVSHHFKGILRTLYIQRIAVQGWLKSCGAWGGLVRFSCVGTSNVGSSMRSSVRQNGFSEIALSSSPSIKRPQISRGLNTSLAQATFINAPRRPLFLTLDFPSFIWLGHHCQQST